MSIIACYILHYHPLFFLIIVLRVFCFITASMFPPPPFIKYKQNPRRREQFIMSANTR